MPIGFIFLVITTIYILFYMKSKFKWILIPILFLFMLGYFVSPFVLDRVSINILFIIAAISVFVYSCVAISCKKYFLLIIMSLMVVLVYVLVVSRNSDYITSIYQAPIMIIVFLANLIFLFDFKSVMFLNSLSFLLLSIANLFVESGLGFINFASVDLCNAIIIVTIGFYVFNLFISKLIKSMEMHIWKK